MKINNYIENVYRELLHYHNIEYEELYTSFSHTKLIEIFSTIHHLLITNYKKMNGRLPTKDGTAHYWAEESRELIRAIESIKGLQRALKNSKYAFTIDEYYEKIIDKTFDFLSESNGSEIPPHMDKIELYYTIPLFNSQDSISLDSLYDKQNVTLKLIGEGSYANVYKYQDPFYKKNFVIKRAKKNLDIKELQRFKREFEQMKKFNSPYIVEVYNYQENKNEYIMEYMNITLDEYIEKNNNTLIESERKGIARQILKAFQYIHSHDILHRDISPKNILIKKYDDVNVVKIADFGLIKIPNSQLTSLGTEFKGYFNDPYLLVDGFHTYNISHETYALTRIVSYVMTGKVNLSGIKEGNLKSIIDKGLSVNKNDRFHSVDQLSERFNKI